MRFPLKGGIFLGSTLVKSVDLSSENENNDIVRGWGEEGALTPLWLWFDFPTSAAGCGAALPLLLSLLEVVKK